MKNEMETKLIDFNGGKILGVRDSEGNIWMGIRKACMDIGLTINQAKRQVKNLQEDIVLSKGVKNIYINTNGGKQYSYCININYVPVWLASINRNALTKVQYNNVINLLNWCLSENFDKYKNDNKLYSFESNLRDEIYDNGYFNDIKIVGKEVKYDFGRVDLIGIKNNNKYIIELKRYKEYNDVIKQCLRYKEGFKKIGENVQIIICQYDCSNISKKAKKYGFKCYEYSKKLNLKKVS